METCAHHADMDRLHPIRIGLAYSNAAAELAESLSADIDYLEFPFELLRHDEGAATLAATRPAILHCSSLSLASAAPPSPALISSVAAWADRLSTPWLGEHLAFIRAGQQQDSGLPVGSSDGAGYESNYEVGFTVSPPMNPRTLANVARSLALMQGSLQRQILLENPPIYVQMPGSTMTQAELFTALCAQTSVGILLDLAHLIISCKNLHLNSLDELSKFPLERVVEVHLSGLTEDAGVFWDDHTGVPLDLEYELLSVALARAPIQAVTHEYNWSSMFSVTAARAEILRTRQLIADLDRR